MKNFNIGSSVQTYNQVRAHTESLTIFNTDSLIDLPDSTYIDTDIQSNVLPNSFYVDAEVQTKSLWKLFKIKIKKLFCINSSGIDITPQDVIVENTMNNLEPSQNIPANELISESSESNIQELAEVYDLMDEFNFGLAISQQNAVFDHKLIEGIHQYFIYYSDIVLSVNPDLINYFI
jgi:hypothetical protein